MYAQYISSPVYVYSTTNSIHGHKKVKNKDILIDIKVHLHGGATPILENTIVVWLGPVKPN